MMELEQNSSNTALVLDLKKSNFLSTDFNFNERSLIYYLTSVIHSFEHIAITFNEGEEIDHHNLMAMISSMDGSNYKNCKRLKIDVQSRNYLLPNGLGKLLKPFMGGQLRQLILNSEESQGISIQEYMEALSVIRENRLNNFSLRVKGLFELHHDKNSTTLQVSQAINIDDIVYQAFASIMLNNLTCIKKLSIQIGSDSSIRDALKYFVPLINQHAKTITQITLSAGSNCHIGSDGLSQFLNSLQNIENLKSLQLKLGGSNPLDSQFLKSLLQIVYVKSSLETLDLDIGNSSKIFKSASDYLQGFDGFHRLKNLRFKIGKMNTFNDGGASFLSKLISSSYMKRLDIYIADLNQFDNLQAIYLFTLFGNIPTLKELSISFEQNMNVSDDCLILLAQGLAKQQNLLGLKLYLCQQQQQTKISSLNILRNITKLNKLINLELQFGGKYILGDQLSQISDGFQKMESLQSFQIGLFGGNGVEYQDLRRFLQGVKSNPNLINYSFNNGCQLSGFMDESEINQNLRVLDSTLISTNNLILSSFKITNQPISFEFNFLSLCIKLPSLSFNFNDHFITNIDRYKPSRDLIVTLSSSEQNSIPLIFSILQLIDDQENIQITFEGVLEISYDKDNRYGSVKFLDSEALGLTPQNVLGMVDAIRFPVNFFSIDGVLQNKPFVISNVIKRIVSNHSPGSYDSIVIRDGETKFFEIQNDEQLTLLFGFHLDNQNETLANICETFSMLKPFGIKTYNLMMVTKGVDIEWKQFYESISDLKHLREINLLLSRVALNAQGNITPRYLEFFYGLLSMVAKNPMLLKINQGSNLLFNQLFKPQQLQLMNLNPNQPINNPPVAQEQIDEEDEQPQPLQNQIENLQNLLDQVNVEFNMIQNLLQGPENQIQQNLQNLNRIINYRSEVQATIYKIIQRRKLLIMQCRVSLRRFKFIPQQYLGDLLKQLL